MLSFSAHSEGSLALTTSTARSSAASAGHAIKATRQLSKRRIHIAGVRLHRQAIEPTPDRLRALPVFMRQGLALAQGRIVADVAQLLATHEAGVRDTALDRGKFKR